MSASSSPKLSIITINLNQAGGLAATLDSVKEQTFRDVEQIVIDGGSTDGSLEVIQARADGLAYWVSEPDGGIYSAMNKGLRAAHGEYVYFLNSGDRLVAADTLEKILGRGGADADLLYGDAVRPGRNGRLREFRHPNPLTVAAFWDRGVCQQAILYARRLFQQHGEFDESLRIAGDWDFNLRVLMAGGTSRHVGFPLVRYQGNGISVREKDTALAEADQVLRRRLPEAVYRDYRELARLRKDVRRLDVMRRSGFLRNVWIAAQWQWQNIKAAVRNAGRGEEA